MNQTAHSLTEVLDGVRKVHLYGHRCTDGQWYNPNAGGRQECPTALAMASAAVAVGVLAGQPAAIADDPAAVRHVLTAMTGFDGDVIDGLPTDEREGWLETARNAIRGAASWLDGTLTPADV